MDENLSDRLATLNGLRNAIVHKYNKFEEDEVFENLDHIKIDLILFVETIDDHLEASMNKPPGEPQLDDIRSDLAPLQGWETVLYGSYVQGTFTPRFEANQPETLDTLLTLDPTWKEAWNEHIERV